jgi:hypothetical protein
MKAVTQHAAMKYRRLVSSALPSSILNAEFRYTRSSRGVTILQIPKKVIAISTNPLTVLEESRT